VNPFAVVQSIALLKLYVVMHYIAMVHIAHTRKLMNVTLVVSRLTPPPPPEIQEMVEELRIPETELAPEEAAGEF